VHAYARTTYNAKAKERKKFFTNSAPILRPQEVKFGSFRPKWISLSTRYFPASCRPPFPVRARDVFTPGSFPTVTFVGDHLVEKQQILRDALDSGNTVLALSGPSKSGKTVFVEKVVGKENLIHVTGSGIDSPGKLWKRVFDIIGTPVHITTAEERAGNLSRSTTGEVGVFVAKAQVQASASSSWRDSVTRERSVDYLQLLVREWKDTNFVLFIDDFHYIARDAQLELAQHIKEAIRQGVVIICASVPYHSDDVIRANPDLRGRIVTIDFDYWQPEVLKRIAEQGFSALGASTEAQFVSALADEAAGSPQLMQALCLNACLAADFKEVRQGGFTFPCDQSFFKQVCMRTAMSADYGSTVERMKEGPKTRGTERNRYRLINGDEADVYPIVLRAASQDPPRLNHRYNQLSERIGQICQGAVPVGSSVIGACEHIATIANTTTNSEVIEWDSENDVLDIRDPYLLFYLRWSEFEQDRP
jgi:hypothetical protein